MAGHEAMRVLLIDDDELSRAVLELHLSAAGYEVTEVESGEGAIAVLRDLGTAGFDVVLSDLQMPGLYGPALAEQVRALLGEEVPLLAMSGSQPAAARYAGFDGFLLKPFTPEQFGVVVHGLREKRVVETQPISGGDAAEVLEEATFAQLASMMKPAQMEEIFALSFAELEKHVSRMQSALEAGDTAALQANAHAMKGGFSILGAREMQALGARLETGGDTAADQTATLREIPLAAERLRRMLTSRGLQVNGSRSSRQETK